jgi:hypothetical protein
MSDIFLSYAIEDRAKAAKLASVFAQQHWTVWRDWPKFGSDVHYIAVIRKELVSAKVKVILWSRAAEPRWFPRKKEDEHSEQFLFIPVLLEKVELPPKFSHSAPFDLSDWDGEESHIGLQDLLRYLRALLPTSSPAAPPASFEELPLSEIQENARLGIKKDGLARPKEDERFGGVFISYRRNEAAAYAGRLYDRLAVRFGRERVFLDMENIGRGADFVEAITDAAESCAVMVALISRGWARATGGEQGDEDDYVRLEVAAALGRKIPLIPITIQGASMPRAKELSNDLAPIARRNAFELRDARWERDVEDLILDLEKLLKN